MCPSFSVVNAFTGKESAGNPTPVCFSAEPLEAEDMLFIAKDLAQPVTAFVWSQKNAAYAIRYFTPLMEIQACGHATLAAAALMTEREKLPEILFQTRGGIFIPTTIENGRVTMTFPLLAMQRFSSAQELLQALRIERFAQSFYCPPVETLFLVLHSAQEVEDVTPDFQRLRSFTGEIKEVVVSAAAMDGIYDYVLRSFCPWIGIDEDPATGSVHAALAPIWAGKLKKQNLRARQASKRGGEIYLSVKSSEVQISGDCTPAMQAESLVH